MNVRAACFALLFTLVSVPALANWDGMWAGNWGGAEQDGIQIIMVGNSVTAIFWRGDYMSNEMHSTVSPDGNVLTITWKDGGATLTRDGENKAKFQIHAGANSASGEVTLEK
ncbi:MAG TPA: hypothetical protein VMJ73_00770 [Rhizomicrobium sp.]|nr:hypothetical protein [Rhizomicrobium sp.]